MLMQAIIMSGEQHEDYRREATRDRLVQEALADRPKRASLLAKVMAQLSRQAATPRTQVLQHAGARS